MGDEGGEDGWRPWQVIPQLVRGAVAAPVVVGFVALGAVVLAARSLRDVAREAWSWVPARRAVAPVDEPRRSNAA